MKTVKAQKPKAAPRPKKQPLAKKIGTAPQPAVKASAPRRHTAAAVETGTAAVRKTAAAVKKAAPAKKPKKRAPQHTPEYFAELGRKGGGSLVKQRGPEYFARIAKLSHPRSEYKGGRPKGSTREKKQEEQARMDALLKTAAKKLVKKKR